MLANAKHSSKLNPRKSKLETQASKLNSSIPENFKDRESSLESRLLTYLWAVLYLQENMIVWVHVTHLITCSFLWFYFSSDDKLAQVFLAS